MHTSSENNTKVLEFIIAGLLCFFCLFGLLLYVFSGSDSSPGKRGGKAGMIQDQASMAFGHNKYILSVKCAEDMSKYLKCSNIDKKDVAWTAESNQVQVGSDGMVAIQNYNVTSKLTAKSKKDSSVVAECEISSLSEKMDFQNKVADYNMVRTEDEEQQDGTVTVYNHNSVESKINVYQERVSAGVRKDNYQWDSRLFYQLEEVEGTEGGGKINGYHIARKQFINEKSGNVMEYEIYQHPTTDIINKIVSIEHMDTILEVTEYYYTKKGKVNFVFQYQTENYLPSYANPDIYGDRYLFSHDTMVTWRMVKGKENITNYCANQAEKRRLKRNNWAKVKEYDKLSRDKKRSFDEIEKKMLNGAYNTLHKVQEYEGISTIRGQVKDESEKALSGVGVKLYSETYDCQVYSGVTNDAGYYEIFVPSRKGTYEMTYSLEGKNIEEKMYHIDLAQDDLGVDQEMVYMVKDTTVRDYQVKLYDATKNREESSSRLINAELVFRRGINNYEGNKEVQVFTDELGSCRVDLKPGMYTVEANSGGYMKEYRNVFFDLKNDFEVAIFLTPSLKREEVRIVLTWSDTPRDEDSHLFTPEQEHICYYQKEATGANLDVDDTDGYGPETVTITHLKQGVYKYYVADFTHCASNEVTSKEMSESDAVVRVYTYRGLEKTFYVPKNQKGVIWEVFSIRNGEIVPAQRYYHSIEDKQWCTRKG